MIEQAIPLHPAAVQSVFALIPDQRLVKFAARGSTPAFATIYRRHHKELYRYCRSLLGNDDDAGDALQNTMLRALRGLEGERREIALRPWLFRIAHNESISLMRSRDRATPVAPEEIARAGDSDDHEVRERFAALISDIGQLSSHQKSALVMRELSGLEFGEIAAALETSPEAAKQAVYQARVALGELAEGRDMSCDEIRRKVSVEDRRLLRGRRVRAHLRGCSDCREFEHQIRERSGTLAGLAPTISVPGAATVLHGVLGGGAGGAGGGVASLLGAAVGAKAVATAVTALVVGAGLYAAERQATGQSTDTRVAASSPEPAWAGSNRDRSTDRAVTTGARGRAAGAPALGGAGNATEGEGGSSARSGSNTAGVGGATAPGAGGAFVPADPPAASGSVPPSPTGASSSVVGDAAPPPGDGGTLLGPDGTPPGQTASPAAPEVTRPGQGGIPPAQAGIPPAQAGIPPAQAGSAPGEAGAPPGQTGVVPSHSPTPPGQDGIPPGEAGTPSGQGGRPPGQTASPAAPEVTPPGQGGIPPAQAGIPPAQAGIPPAQAGIPPAQAGIPPAQAGIPPAQAGIPPAQAGIPPAQAGIPPAQDGIPPDQAGPLTPPGVSQIGTYIGGVPPL